MYRFFLLFTALILSLPSFLIAGNKDQEKPFWVTVGKINITGNQITKNGIILREMEVKSGDSLTWSALQKKIVASRQNLLNRGLFNFVDIKPDLAGPRKVNLNISVVERWYIWPIPILAVTDRNLNVWWEQKKLSRIDYGVNLKVNNFRGRMEVLNLLLQNGYNKSFQIKWNTPYVNKRKTWGLGFWAGIVFNHETDYTTRDNKLLYFGEAHDFVKKHGFADLSFSYRPLYRKLNSFWLKWNHYTLSDSLLTLNPAYAYGQKNFSYLSFRYNFRLDYRDYAPYPLNGYYLEFDFEKTGLGILNKKVDEISTYISYDRYLHLKNRWYYAFNVSSKLVPNRYRPYFLERGLGYPPFTLRGYELYVINGMWTNIFRSNFKYELISKHVFQLPYIKSDTFGKIFYALYANIILDMGYVMDRRNPNTNPLTNKLIYGTGLGLDYVTYYDTVIRFEYTLNGQGQTHFFISLVAPI
ncbi:MAG: hypothetical protein JXR71_05615 [Bacteroidales bacterium]|nr:hypothetical protein [Bacteroidales bacterium]